MYSLGNFHDLHATEEENGVSHVAPPASNVKFTGSLGPRRSGLMAILRRCTASYSRRMSRKRSQENRASPRGAPIPGEQGVSQSQALRNGAERNQVALEVDVNCCHGGSVGTSLVLPAQHLKVEIHGVIRWCVGMLAFYTVIHFEVHKIGQLRHGEPRARRSDRNLGRRGCP